jgi:glycosyltransferase involved in cell wall biosynthesis
MNLTVAVNKLSMGKIILDCDLMKHRNSGLYQYCLNIGNAVNRLLMQTDSKDKIRYYVPESEAMAFDVPENCIVEKKYHKAIKPFLWDCDVWHAPFQSGRIIPKNGRTKVLLTVHDLNCLHEGKPVCEQRKSLDHTQKLIDHSDAIVCISEFSKSDVLKHCDVKNKPVYVIHNGTHRLHTPSLNTLSYKPRLPFLFGMGYVNRKKNFHVLLPILRDNNYELVIAGRLDEPDYISSMMQQARELGIEERVHLLGPVSEEEKSWYLKNCLAYMHPSLAEGFGAPVVEAMAFGKPMFLSTYTSLPEIAGNVAFYFSNYEHDHMHSVFKQGMELYNQNGLYKRIMQKGSEYDWEKKAVEYLEVYRSLM